MDYMMNELEHDSYPRTGKLEGYLRIIPAGHGRSCISVDRRSDTVSVTRQHREHNFTMSNVFEADVANKSIFSTIFKIGRKDSVLNWVISGYNATVLTYGEVDSGKSSVLIPSYAYVMRQLVNKLDLSNYRIGVSFWEIVYDPEVKSETINDLLSTSYVEGLEEAEELFHEATARSVNFNPDLLNNRSHFFIKVILINLRENTCTNLHLVDTAGFQPAYMHPEIRRKLGSDEQNNFIRIGLNQLRSIVYENFKGESKDSILSSKKSKLAQVLGSLILGNSRTFLICTVREDSNEALRVLEFLEKAGEITVECTKTHESHPTVSELQCETDERTQRIEQTLEHLNTSTPENIREELLKYSLPYKTSSRKHNSSPDSYGSPLDRTPSMYRGEYYVTRKHYDSIVDSLRDQEEDKIEQNTKIEDSEYHYKELKRVYDIKVQDLKLENNSLSRKLRLLEGPPEQVLEDYEEDVKKLERKLIALQEDILTRLNGLKVQKVTLPVDEKSISANRTKKDINELKKIAKNHLENLIGVETENFGLRRDERHWNLNRKQLEEDSKQAAESQTELDRNMRALQKTSETLKEMQSKRQEVMNATLQARKELEKLTQQNSNTNEKIKRLKEKTGYSEKCFRNARIDKVGKESLNLISRLQNDISEIYDDDGMIQALESIKFEISNVYDWLSEAPVRERSLVASMTDFNDDKATSKPRKKYNFKYR